MPKPLLASRLPQCHKDLALLQGSSRTPNFSSSWVSSPSVRFLTSLLFQPCVLWVFSWSSSLAPHPQPMMFSCFSHGHVQPACSIYCSLSLLWTPPGSSGCSLPPVYDKNLPLRHVTEQSRISSHTHSYPCFTFVPWLSIKCKMRLSGET